MKLNIFIINLQTFSFFCIIYVEELVTKMKLSQHANHLISALRSLFGGASRFALRVEVSYISVERIVGYSTSDLTLIAPRFLYSSDYIWFLRKTNLGR